MLLAGNEESGFPPPPRRQKTFLKNGNIKIILAAKKSTVLPMKAMKLEAIVRHRDSIKPREAFRSGTRTSFGDETAGPPLQHPVIAPLL